MASEDFGGWQVSGMYFAHGPEWAVLAEEWPHKIYIHLEPYDVSLFRIRQRDTKHPGTFWQLPAVS